MPATSGLDSAQVGKKLKKYYHFSIFLEEQYLVISHAPRPYPRCDYPPPPPLSSSDVLRYDDDSGLTSSFECMSKGN